MDGFDDGDREQGLHGSILCCFQLIDISIGPNRLLMVLLETLMKDLDTDQDWNPGSEKNKTELFFEKVFKEEDILDNFCPKVESEPFVPSERKPSSPRTEHLLQVKFQDLCLKLIKQRHSRHAANIHNYLLPLIPKLCAFDPKIFERTILKDVIDYCLEEIEKKQHQKSALLCLGLVVNLVCNADLEPLFKKDKDGKSKMEIYLDKTIIPKLKSVLSLAFKQRVTHPQRRIEPAFFKCMELISNGIGELHEELWKQNKNHSFIDYIIAFGLVEITPEWMKCVQSLNQHSTKDQISHGMEQILLKILFPKEKLPSNISYETSEDHACLSSMSILQQFKNHDRFEFGAPTTERQVLALQTLEMFEFKDVNRYVKFINRIKNFFKLDTDIRIKIAASRTLARILKLFVVSPLQAGTDFIGDSRISKIVKKMLIAPRLVNYDESLGTKLKLTIYRSLDSDFDGYLVHQDNLELIINAIHQSYPPNRSNVGKKDKYRERLLVQEAIMEIIGRLNAVNAAETMPQIRHMINDLWTELKHPELEICQPAARLLQVMTIQNNRHNYFFQIIQFFF